MAIPISWPSSDDVEDSYRSLDILLEQLLMTVRQVLLQRRRQQDMSSLLITRQRNVSHQNMQVGPESSLEPVPELPTLNHPRLPLPDLVPEPAPECEANRRKTPTSAPTGAVAATVSAWVQVGAELRRIADTFRTERASEQNSMDRKTSGLKEASLLSIICPALGRSVWTTVALLLGWGLFTRTR